MRVSTALTEMGRFLDGFERGRVTRVEFCEAGDSPVGPRVEADIEVPVAADPADGAVELRLGEARLDDGGALHLGFETEKAVLPSTDGDVTVTPSGVATGSDGRLAVRLSATIPTGEGASDRAAGSDGSDAAGPVDDRAAAESEDPADSDESAEVDDSTPTWGGRDVPPFRDPDLLAEVYESCETFGEMTEALEMDVTAETVRRYMIDYGIHEPASYDTSADDVEEEPTDAAEAGEGTDSPVVLADGVGLPEEVTVDAIVETVRQSNTIYEVGRDLGVGRDDALEALQELDLLELVSGRLATEAERQVSRDEVIERLRESAASQ